MTAGSFIYKNIILQLFNPTYQFTCQHNKLLKRKLSAYRRAYPKGKLDDNTHSIMIFNDVVSTAEDM
jgi:hypothetical protein